MADADKRKQELELKRKKLAELRKAREERKTTSGKSAPVATNNKSNDDLRKDIDDLVESLVGEQSSPVVEDIPASPAPKKYDMLDGL